jgi:ribosomal protein S18 acetylase RimI-like enzyme
MRPLTFQDALIATYLNNPCQVLPNALWKTLSEVEASEYSFTTENGLVFQLEMWDDDSLIIYWDRERLPPHIPEIQAKNLELAIVHQDYLEFFPTTRLVRQEAYFRLIHHHQSIAAPTLPSGFRFAEVNIETETALVCDLIDKCYDDLHPKETSVRNWAQHPVFAADLWLWVIDSDKDLPVGLGIAELDTTIGEASLEWIQVLPAYRSRGLAKAVVLEILNRVHGRVTFTTVSGKVSNRTNPEQLYRRCGFTGQDVWWILRR